jgi:hypothetical protein
MMHIDPARECKLLPAIRLFLWASESGREYANWQRFAGFMEEKRQKINSSDVADRPIK